MISLTKFNDSLERLKIVNLVKSLATYMIQEFCLLRKVQDSLSKQPENEPVDKN